MSAHKNPTITLSNLARRDFRDLVNYTMETWGERQVAIYSNHIHDALQAIVDYPLKGKLLDKGIRKVAAQKHKIFYRAKGQNIVVLRILHERMDEGAHVGL